MNSAHLLNLAKRSRNLEYNLRSLQILEAVYRHRSIAGAAAELNISASAVSHQIRNLSDEIG